MTTPAPQAPPPARTRFLKTGGFPLKSKGPITALDWDERILRVAQSSGRGEKAAIDALVIEPLGLELDVARSDPAAAGAALAEALRRLKLKPGAVVMGIPRSLVFLRALALPPADSPEALASMVYFQITRDLPFRAEDAVIDFQVTPAPTPAPPADAGDSPRAPVAAKVDVLVAVVKREVLEFYERVATAAGLRLAAVGFQSYANARAVQACWPAEARGAVALVSLRQREVVIDIVAGDVVLFSRTAAWTRTPGNEDMGPVPAAATAGTDAAGIIELIQIEVVRSLHNFGASEGRQPVETLLIAGDHPQAELIARALEARCKLPCRLLEQMPLSAARLATSEAATVSAALTAVGLALSAQDQAAWPFNFLHPKRPPAARGWRRSRWLSLAALVVIILAGAWSLRAALIHRRQKDLDQLIDNLNQASTPAKRALYRDMRVRARTVHDWVGERKEWLDHWAALSVLLPDCTEVYVSSIAAGSHGVLHLSLQARNGEILAAVDKRLREAGYELHPLAITPTSDRYGYGFQTSLELTLPARLKVDWKSLPAPARPANDGSLERRK